MPSLNPGARPAAQLLTLLAMEQAGDAGRDRVNDATSTLRRRGLVEDEGPESCFVRFTHQGRACAQDLARMPRGHERLRQVLERLLRGRLLAQGGREVSLSPDLLPATDVDSLDAGETVPRLDDTLLLLRHGRFDEPAQQAARPVLAGNALGQCHGNAAHLFWTHAADEDPARRLTLWTGYALDEQGEHWRRHSWLTRPDRRIVETTLPQAAYYGLALAAGEGEAAPQGNAWHFAALYRNDGVGRV